MAGDHDDRCAELDHLYECEAASGVQAYKGKRYRVAEAFQDVCKTQVHHGYPDHTRRHGGDVCSFSMIRMQALKQ